MDKNIKTKAVIYCRTAATGQADALDLQEARCREYAKTRGYNVTHVYTDNGTSGNAEDRPSFQTMLNFLKQSKDEVPIIVIVDDISRLARKLETCLKLRDAISEAGGKLEISAHVSNKNTESCCHAQIA